MVTGVWQALRRIVRGREAKPARDGRAASGNAAQRPDRVGSRQLAFEQAVRKLSALSDGGAGRLRVVSLAEFKDAVGDKWPRLADKVAIVADNLIRRHIGPGNLYQRQDEDTFLLAFVTVSPDEARRRATAIAQDLSRFLLGERCIKGERPLAVAAHIHPRRALDKDGQVDYAALRSALAESRSFLDHLGDCPDEDGLEGWQELKPEAPRRPVVTEWEPIVVPRQKPPEEPWQGVGPLPATGKLSLLWRPTWVAEGEAISAYSARVVRVDGEDAPPLEGPLAYPGEDPATALRIDRFVVSAAVRDLRDVQGAGASVIIPVNWSSMARDRRGPVVAVLADLTEEMRHSRVMMEVFRIPDDAAEAEIEEVSGFLRKLCGDVLLRMRLSSPLVGQAGRLGATKVGLDLSELRPDERMNDDKLLETLERLQGSADYHGIGSYVWSARRRRVVGEVVQSGFEMVNGPGLMRDVGRPAVVVPAPRQRFALAG